MKAASVSSTLSAVLSAVTIAFAVSSIRSAAV